MSGLRSQGEPAVILVDGTDCRELDAVRTLLVDGFGVPVVRVDQRDLGGAPISLEQDPAIFVMRGGRVRPTVVWLRHASPEAISATVAGAVPDQTGPGGTSTPPAPRTATLSRLLAQLAAVAATTVPGTEPTPARQLSDAARLGVRVPRTIFTTDVEAAAARLRSPRVVVKAPGPRWAEPGPGTGVPGPPQIVTRGDAWPAWAGDGAQVAVQEYVDHVRELRVYYLHGGICAFQVDKPSPASLWTDPGRVTVTPVECPPGLSKIVQLLSAEWGLRYGAFDLLLTPAGDPVFLEVNVDGDWLYFEKRAGWNGVTLMAAAMVYEQHVRVSP